MRSGIILAGGKSSRMGRAKELLRLDDKPMISWVAERLSSLVDEVILSASKEDLEYALEMPVRVAADSTTGLGPISGLQSSFRMANGEYVAVAPCDTPFILPELYKPLLESADGFDGAVPKVNGMYEPLCAVYRREPMLEAIEKVLSSHEKRPIDTHQYLKIVEIDEKRIRQVDSCMLSFLNINTTEEFEFAQDFVAELPERRINERRTRGRSRS
jgi:molybdopterin-guanine dinucleotide biosynthesis protein A